MAAVTEFRKIELQSPADLTYLEANVKRAARSKIDNALPPSAAPEGEDKLRRRVEELVEEYIRNTFTGVRANISINGMEPGEVEDVNAEEFEAFDSRLADRIRALETTKESLTEKVADMRRSAPAQSSRNFQSSFLQQAEALDHASAQEQQRTVQQAETEAQAMQLGELQRMADVEVMWRRGTAGLAELKGALTETAAKLDRAEKVAEYVERR